MDPSRNPVQLPARKIPVLVRDRFREEQRRFEKLNVIAPLDEPTKWVSQIVVAVMKPAALGVCVDQNH